MSALRRGTTPPCEDMTTINTQYTCTACNTQSVRGGECTWSDLWLRCRRHIPTHSTQHTTYNTQHTHTYTHTHTLTHTHAQLHTVHLAVHHIITTEPRNMGCMSASGFLWSFCGPLWPATALRLRACAFSAASRHCLPSAVAPHPPFCEDITHTTHNMQHTTCNTQHTTHTHT